MSANLFTMASESRTSHLFLQEYATEIIFSCLVVFLLYKYITRNYDYWARQNVPFLKTRFLLGSHTMGGKPLHENELDLYKLYGRMYGRFDGRTPVLTVAEPDHLKNIFVKDFHIFPNRRDMKFNDPVMDNTLFALEGEDWKRVRNIVSPTLTSAKLKKMLPLLVECSDVMVDNLEQAEKEGKAIDCQRVFGAFTIDAIARCAFGMDINSLASENDPFVAKAKVMLNCFMSWRTFLTMIFPRLMKWLRISLLNPETINFYRNAILEVVEDRKDKYVREDFLQLLLDAQNELKDANNNSIKTHNANDASTKENIPGVGADSKQPFKGLSRDEFLAQCVTFFMAGFDATTSLLSHVTYNLAMHKDCQDRVIEEMEDSLAKHDGALNYDSLSDMKYLDAVINECLRLCPPMVRAERRAEEDYVLDSEKNIVLRKGMLVSIPVFAIHRDPEWYPEPDVFDPERFYSPDPSRPQYVHLPFGAGPRHCVGLRFVQLQVKMGLVKILQKFRIVPGSTTPAVLGYTEVRNVLKVNNVEVALESRKAASAAA